MSQLERNKTILVSKDVTVDATGLSDLAEGELAVVKPDGTLLTAGETIADAEYIRIVRGAASGESLKFSNTIKGKMVTGWRGASYAAAVQQVSYLGSNATTGSIESIGASALTAEQEFTFYVRVLHEKDTQYEKQLRLPVTYVAAIGDTEATIVDGLIASAIGSDYFDTAAAPNTKAIIRLAKTTDGANARGISFTGKALTINKYDDNNIVNFELAKGEGFSVTTGIDEYGYIHVNNTKTTTQAASVSSDVGVGNYKQVRDLEKKSKALSNFTKFPVPDGAFEFDAETTENYDMYVIEHFDKHASGDLNGTIENPLMEVIAIPEDAAALNGGELEALLNPWFASCPSSFPAVTL